MVDADTKCDVDADNGSASSDGCDGVGVFLVVICLAADSAGGGGVDVDDVRALKEATCRAAAMAIAVATTHNIHPYTTRFTTLLLLRVSFART